MGSHKAPVGLVKITLLDESNQLLSCSMVSACLLVQKGRRVEDIFNPTCRLLDDILRNSFVVDRGYLVFSLVYILRLATTMGVHL
jgi:hypothetical protein